MAAILKAFASCCWRVQGPCFPFPLESVNSGNKGQRRVLLSETRNSHVPQEVGVEWGLGSGVWVDVVRESSCLLHTLLLLLLHVASFISLFSTCNKEDLKCLDAVYTRNESSEVSYTYRPPDCMHAAPFLFIFLFLIPGCTVHVLVI